MLFPYNPRDQPLAWLVGNDVKSTYFADEKTRELFCSLASATTEDQEVFALLNAAFDAIAHDAFCGIQVPKRLIPKTYLGHYGIDNLWKYNLSKGWRLMYSVAGDAGLNDIQKQECSSRQFSILSF